MLYETAPSLEMEMSKSRKCTCCGASEESVEFVPTVESIGPLSKCVCDEDSSNDNSTCVQDCSGTWGGDAVEDECGVCGGDNTSCEDCLGIPNGTATLDNCDTCDSNPATGI